MVYEVPDQAHALKLCFKLPFNLYSRNHIIYLLDLTLLMMLSYC